MTLPASSCASSSIRARRSTTPSRTGCFALSPATTSGSTSTRAISGGRGSTRSSPCRSSATRSPSRTGRTRFCIQTASRATACSTSAGPRTPRRCRGTSRLSAAAARCRSGRRSCAPSAAPATTTWSRSSTRIRISLPRRVSRRPSADCATRLQRPRPGRSPADMDVRYDGISKTFGTQQALEPLDLHVPDGTFLALLGPSGCGKTTALRLLAGLEIPSAGRIFIGERNVTHMPPRGRDVAMVFQSYALYPHLKVFDNIAYPLRVRKIDKSVRAKQVQEVAELLGLERLLDRRPRQLSGGQRQRVALARAIIRRPQAFLMDEPLSNLDAQLRLQMRVEIKRLQRELSATTLYVTHDQVEAMTMADTVAVMSRGRLQQLASPAELYARPANLFVARFCGSPPMNVLDGSVADGRFANQTGSVPLPHRVEAGAVKLGFRPEHAGLTEPGTPGSFAGEIYVVEPLGNETLVTVDLDGTLVNVRDAADFS